MSVQINIDPEDYIEDISDELILSEFERRHLQISDVMYLTMRDAYESLLANRPGDARAILERALYPKWGSVDECETAYRSR